MRHIKEFENIRGGEIIVIMGGGPSLVDDLKLIWKFVDHSLMWGIPVWPYHVAVNFHALEIGQQADYMVFGDKLDKVPVMKPYVESFDGIRFSPYQSSDVFMDPEVVYKGAGNSGELAAWLGCYMGGDPVLLAGMDCYQGPVKYCHNVQVPDHPCRNYPLENHLAAWRRFAKFCPGADRIRSISGPTVQVFGLWEKL